jgi:hypothetical protein
MLPERGDHNWKAGLAELAEDTLVPEVDTVVDADGHRRRLRQWLP